LKILIVSRAISYMSEDVYDLPKIFKPAFDSLFTLKKRKDWKVDIMFLNHAVFTPKSKGLRFSWLYESMPSFMMETTNIAIPRNYQYLMIAEPDIVLPKDAIIRLIDTINLRKCDIAVGIYPERPSKVKDFSRRGQPLNGWLVCMPWNKNPKAEMGIARRKSFPVDGCAGFGCVLMNHKAMNECRFPSRGKDGDGPDFGFYENARVLKLKIYANPNVRCGHIENNGKIIRGPP